jgi:hypothetical protein
MAMLFAQMSEYQTQTTGGTFDNEVPNTEPTDTAYTNWKAKNYTPATALNGAKYDFGKMYKMRKIYKANSKLGATAMEA